MLTKIPSAERSHLLCVGTLARLQMAGGAGSFGVEGTISAIDDHRVTVRFHDLSAPLSPRLDRDRPAVLTVWDRYGMHRADAQIHGVVEEGGSAAVIVGAPTHFVGTQTRRFSRVSARLELALERPGLGVTAPSERTLSWDISAGGLSFLSDSALEIDERVDVTVLLPQELAGLASDVPKIETRVVRTEIVPDTTRRFFAVEFQNITQRRRERLVEVVLGLQRFVR